MRLSRRFMRRLAAPVSLLYRFWSGSLRYEETGRESLDRAIACGRRLVICLWHGETFALLRAGRGLPLAAITSRSRDGELMAGILTRLGFCALRGSRVKDGLGALRGGVRCLKEEGLFPCVAMDGPRGPRHKIKDGVFFLARHGEAWLLPVRAFYTRRKTFNSWDKYSLPLPFSRVRIAYGEPCPPPETELDAAALARAREYMLGRMTDLEKHAFEQQPGL